MKRIIIFFILMLLSGCWSSQELDNSALVHGVGMDKADDKLHVSMEIIKPGGNEGSEQELGQSEGKGSGDHIVIEETTDTLLEGARESIKYTKRRLDFGHTEAWFISEELARDGFVRSLDVIRRDQMLRLNSHLFITSDNPREILNTPTLYEHLVATELASSLEQTKYIAEYAPITIREFYKSLEGPLSSAYIPIIYLDEVNKQQITAINGTAVINNNRMVGKLNKLETAGLNMLLNNIHGGSIQVSLNEDEDISLEISSLNTNIIPELYGEQLKVIIQVEIDGTLADNMTEKKVNKKFFTEIEQKFSEHAKNAIHSTLDKLQQKLKTDITSIGLETHRKYPKKWNEIQHDWNDIFANAEVTIDVNTKVSHQGLINEDVNHNDKPHNNPYHFLH